MLTPEWPGATAFARSESAQDQHIGGRGIGGVAVAADQVAPVGGTEGPGQFELAEAEQGSDGRRLVGRSTPTTPEGRASAPYYCVPVLIAYLLGEIGTIGSLIWPMRLISLVH